MWRDKTHQSHILYVPRTWQKWLRLGFFLIVLLIALISVFADRIDHPIGYKIRGTIISYTTPITKVISTPYHWYRSFIQASHSYLFVHKKNALLISKNEELRTELFRQNQLRNENNELKKLLNYVDAREYNSITTPITAATKHGFLHHAIIHAGSNQQVQKGQAVRNTDGLVGRILEVYPDHARLLLISDHQSRIPVITSLSQHRLILSGRGPHDPALLYLPDNHRLTEGEIISSSGDGKVFPAAIPIGVAYKEGERFFMKPFVQWHQLYLVEVMQAKEE